MNNIMDIQIGERTHHQDQSMTEHNFKVMKRMDNNPVKPIPDPPEVFWVDI